MPELTKISLDIQRQVSEVSTILQKATFIYINNDARGAGKSLALTPSLSEHRLARTVRTTDNE